MKSTGFRDERVQSIVIAQLLELIMGNIRNTLLGLLFFCLPLCRLLSLDSNELK